MLATQTVVIIFQLINSPSVPITTYACSCSSAMCRLIWPIITSLRSRTVFRIPLKYFSQNYSEPLLRMFYKSILFLLKNTFYFTAIMVLFFYWTFLECYNILLILNRVYQQLKFIIFRIFKLYNMLALISNFYEEKYR